MDCTMDEEMLSSFENCSAFSTREEMCEIAQKFIGCLRSYRVDENMQLNSLEALCQITSDVLSEKTMEKDVSEQYFGESFWLEDVHSAMINFPNSSDLQETACRCLSALLQECPKLCHFIGEEEGKLPLHLNVTSALEKYFERSNVFQSACKVISLMSSNCEILQQEFIKKSLQKDLLKKMATSEDYGDQTSAYEVLVSLSRANVYFKRRLLKDDILSYICNVFEKFPMAYTVQEQAIILLATLANDIELVRQQCIVEEIHLILLEVLDRFSCEKSLVEVTFEALGVICAADGAPEIVRKCNGMRSALDIMDKHSKNLEIQKKGIVMLQLLVTNRKLSVNTFSSVVATIRRAMVHFPRDSDVQTEACVALQLLAEQSYQASIDLIKLNVHEQLFKIFENFPTDDGVLDVASGCIYLLACKRDLKNQMLLSACALGLLRAAECLIQLGADVNYGRDGNTPLCLACRANDLELVNFLLKQAVADVHNALAFCLNTNRHNIAGFLLKHMGHDEDAGTITLTGLKLGSLLAEWLTPALMGDAVYSSHIASNQWWALVEKARQSRIMRSRLSSSICSTLGDEDDTFLARSLSEISHREESISEESTLATRHREDGLPKDSSFETCPVSTPARSELPEHAENRSWVDSNHRYQLMNVIPARVRSVTGASIPYSSNDPRLINTHEGSKDIILPENYDSDDTISLEETGFYPHPSGRRYSDSFHTMSTPPDLRGVNIPMLLRRVSSVDMDTVDGASPQMSKKKSLPRSKSGSMVGAGMDKAAGPLPRTPVHRLDLSCNEIQNVDILVRSSGSLVKNLSQVEKLDLSHNKLEAIPDDLNKMMPHLRQLLLKHNHLRVIPACVFTCSSLETLDLSHNKIAHVAKPVPILSSFLLHLDLSNNMIKEFPAWFGDCFRLLTFLDLSFNCLGTISDQSVRLNRLQSLNMSHNNIRVVPPRFMTQMKQLESFNASHNDLKSLPDSVAQFLTKLGVVKLSHNKLIEKPPFYLTKFVLLLPNVHTVDLSDNGLISVAQPHGWATQCLKDLNISCNKIKNLHLTNGAKNWAFLKRLDLSFNQLKQIPKGIGELKALGQLNVSCNTRITVLPDEMGNLSKLWEFLYDDVKLDMNASILRGRTRDLVGHLHARLKNSASFPQRKIVVCGPGGSGKSTLLRLLRSSKVLKKARVQDKRNLKGKGKSESLEVQKWLINDVKADCRCCSRKNVTLILRVWEFPGYKASGQVHRCFLSEAALHVLVYDVSGGVKEVENLKPWLVNIQDQCPNSGVILVGTHLDKVVQGQQQTYLRDVSDLVKKIHATSGLPEIRGHFVVSCLQKDSRMDNLARRLLNLAMACNSKGNQIHNHKVPKSFIRLMEIIEGKVDSLKEKAGVVNLSFLRKVVQDSKLDIDQEELNEAIVFLRQSGLLVNYAKPAAKLNELFFLRPARLATLITKVVNSLHAVSPSELIERDSLCSIFVEEGFSESITPQLLRLLEDFEIALPVYLSYYLVTSHLSEKRPQSILPMGSILRRRYNMPYVPVGFWGRLVVHLLLYREEMIDVQIPRIIDQRGKTEPYQYWQKGFLAHWSDECCFTVEILVNVLEILVPSNRLGHILLGNLVYHIDTLLQEWFPDLCGMDPLYGYPKIRKTTFCISCQEHQFPIEKCITKARSSDFIECPLEDAVVPLEQQVPDIFMSHVDQRYFIEEKELEYEQTVETLLGEGSFGRVYRAKYKDRFVAAKVFRLEIECEPRKHLEQEVRFLAKFRHPSIIDLVGMCLRPFLIAVLELAPLGSLNALFRRDQKLSRGMQHRIAMQVAEGLAFLHHHTIVYRDLKPHNILIFSLSLGTLTNAKISDFGSSRHGTPCGFIASEGTPGYRAPEVARGDVVYHEKVDIFSFGMLLYELATGGKQPFNNLRFRSELDEAVISGRPMDPIVVSDSPPWPDMQDLLDHMLEAQPERRPTADQVYERLSGPEFISLKRDVAVCKGQAVECMALRRFSENHNRGMEVWIGSGASDWSDIKSKGNNNEEHSHTSQLSRLDLSSAKPKGCKGMILRDGRIMCIACVKEDLILVGTQTGKLWVYNAREEKCLHAMAILPDALLCLRHTTIDGQDQVFAGLANGQLAMYYISEFYNPPKTARTFNVGGGVCCADKPVLCMVVGRKRLLCGMGHNIVAFKLGLTDMLPEYHWSVAGNTKPHKGLVSNIVVDKQGLWTSTKDSCRVELWDFKTHKLRAFLNCEDIIRATEPCEESSRGMRVVSLLIHRNVLWVGTGGGRILLIDTRSMSPLMTINRHKSAVRCLTTAVLKECGKSISVVLSGGLGFVPRQSSSRLPSCRDFGYVLVWESGIHEESKYLDEYKQKRQEWLLNHTNR